MSECHPAKITELGGGKDYTKITFTPDLSRFGMTHMEADIVALMTKRVYDVAGCLSKVKVTLNGKSLAGIRSFLDYCNLYILEETHPKFYERVNERWEVCVSISNGQPQQVSFVNAICTSKGGTHVQHVLDKLVKPLQAALAKKKAVKDADIKPHQIKQHIFVFVNCLIVNPVFESQTKDTLTLQVRKFGSECALSEQFVGKVLKSGLVDVIAQWAQFKQKKQWERQQGPKARGRVSGIAKLDDANDAGSARSQECTLILTEGDSAKSLALAGLDVIGRDFYGVFPLRGKLLNVRDATLQQVKNNKEVQALAEILGLHFGKEMQPGQLRYGHVMIMTDQDHDGSHIKGLVINFFHHFWPKLAQTDGFLQAFITPILKVFRGSQELRAFFSLQDFRVWADQNNMNGLRTKYYKGLGTSDKKEAKAYFAAIEQHRKLFVYADAADDERIDLAFSKKRVEDRKAWIRNYNEDDVLDAREPRIQYRSFVDRELIHFSVADCKRSIPSMLDGLKPGQRKVLYTMLTSNYKVDTKVVQVSGKVMEKAAYHHGDASLNATIIGMAQNFVGSNNINLLVPSGQFGSRIQGGKDASQPRYLHTALSAITRTIFHKDDEPLLAYEDDDGQKVEPKFYVPVIPMVLVNGADGIGTGFSTSIPNFNPLDCIKHMRHMLRLDGALGAADAAAAAAEPPLAPLAPWYKGFKRLDRARRQQVELPRHRRVRAARRQHAADHRPAAAHVDAAVQGVARGGHYRHREDAGLDQGLPREPHREHGALRDHVHRQAAVDRRRADQEVQAQLDAQHRQHGGVRRQGPHQEVRLARRHSARVLRAAHRHLSQAQAAPHRAAREGVCDARQQGALHSRRDQGRARRRAAQEGRPDCAAATRQVRAVSAREPEEGEQRRQQ
jgi:DNA topoisomerase-2